MTQQDFPMLWQQRLLHHEVWQAVEQVRELLGSGLEDSDDVKLVRWRVERALKDLQKLRVELTPDVTVTALDGVLAALERVQERCGPDQRGPRHLADLLNHAEQLADRVAATSARRPNGSALAEVDAANRRWEDLRVTVDAELDVLRDHGRKQQAELEQRLGEADAAVRTAQSAATALEASTVQAQRDTERTIGSLETAWQAALTAVQENAQRTVDGIREDERRDAAAHLEVLQRMRDDVEKAAAAVAGGVIAGDHLVWAEQERKTADRLRLLTFFVAAVGVGMLAWMAADTLVARHGLDAASTAFKALVTLAVAPTFYYAARESGQHRKESRKARATYLAMTAVRPFVAGLPEGDAQSVRLLVAQSVFGAVDSEPAEPLTRKDGQAAE